MANIAISTLTSNYLILNYSLVNRDNFIMINYPQNDGVAQLSYADFINAFLRDNNGYIVNNISLSEVDDSYIIRIDYKYLENKNGIHIFTDANNELIIAKELYDGSYFNELINYEIESLNNIRNIIDEKNIQMENNIKDINDRIWPEVLKIIDNFYNDNLPINFNFYEINQKEFKEYVSNNRSYIYKYIIENNNYLKMVLKSSSLFAGISLCGIFASGLDDGDITFTLSAFMLATSMLIYLSAVGYTGKKLYDLCTSKDKVVRYRKKEI